MVKFRLYYDKDKGTEWLNQMAEEGYAMTRFFMGFWWFEKVEEGKYTYQVDLADSTFGVSNDYREFMKEMDIDIIQTWGPWVYLRKQKADGEFELYTDVESQIKHYTKIRNMFKAITIIELICAFVEVICGMKGFAWGYALAFFMLALMFVFLNTAIKMNNIILELKERNGENTGENMCRHISLFTPIGMMLSSILLLIKDSWTVSDPIIIPFQIVAIILMVIGLYRTMRMRRG